MDMSKNWLSLSTPLLVLLLVPFDFLRAGEQGGAVRKPNILLILADDIGYGDLGCYGASRVRTPNLDRLAARGLRFTDGHSAAATCPPSRYALLTGEYAWRKKGTNVLPGDAALILKPGSSTLPALLRKAGYATAAVGKWHLGLGAGTIDWNGDIKPGPGEVGFDYSFIIPATGDRVPCVYVENHRVAGLDPKDPIQVSYQKKVGDEPTGRERPDLLKMKLSHGHDFTIVNGISRIGYMTGGKAARWEDENMADTLTARAVGFLEKNRDKPFFLYFATHDIHVPRVPHPRFAGKSGCGVRGDAIEQFDASVGTVLAALERLGLTDRTLVVVSSDNGPVVDDGYADGAERDLNGHKPAGPLRGGKYSNFEGGTRVPFLTCWPGTIKPGVSEALVCQVDLAASLAALAGQELPDGAAPDSANVLPALLGQSRTGRELLVEQGPVLSLRVGTWKFIPPGPKGQGKGQLYNLADDLAETRDVASQHPERVQEMSQRLQQIREKGRSRGQR
jgi:arylsulfatase A-like enzyme